MKKLLKIFSTIALLLSLNSCNKNKDKKQIYAPDGAPALALAYVINKDNKYISNYTIVDSSTIAGYVTGIDPKADIAIVPVNLAFAQQSIYENYKIFGTATHGNLYMLSFDGNQINAGNLHTLLGKTIGVISLNSFPGLIIKLILEKANLEYTIIQNDGVINPNKINLKSIDGSQIGTDNSIDYYIAAEPAISAKLKALESKGLSLVSDLQNMYKDLYETSYPQAIFIAKNSLIENNKTYLENFISNLEIAEEYNYLERENINTIISAIQNNLTEGLAPTFNEKTLTREVIQNSNVRFINSNNSKQSIIDFIEVAKNVMPLHSEFTEYYF